MPPTQQVVEVTWTVNLRPRHRSHLTESRWHSDEKHSFFMTIKGFLVFDLALQHVGSLFP